MNTLIKRTLTALVAGSGVLALLVFAKRNDFRWAVGLFLAICVGIAIIEFCELMEEAGFQLRPRPLALLASTAFFLYSLTRGQINPLLMVAFLVVAIINTARRVSLNDNLKNALAALLAFIYIPWLLHFFYLIYLAESGIIHSINVLFIVWGYDSGAYLFGRLVGKHKIAPHISPNKTLEGVIGGLFLAYGGASLSPIWYPYRMWIPHIAILAVLVGLAAQLGDLTESSLKRIAGVKDSGVLFPGHGGMLDRIDGLLFALPVFYFYFHFILRFI